MRRRGAQPPGSSANWRSRCWREQLVGAAQSLANWWDEHRDVPRDQVLAIAMDFAWIGLERLGEGEGWKP